MKYPSVIDLLYLNSGNIEKAAKAANLPLPNNYVSPSAQICWEVKDLKDLMKDMISKENTDKSSIILIDSLSEYQSKGN